MKAQIPERTVPCREQDAELLPNAKSAQNEAIMRLFRRYAPHTRNIVRRVLAARLRNIFDPQDLLQEIAVNLLAKPIPARISTPADFARYVGGMAKNIALALNRKHLDGRSLGSASLYLVHFGVAIGGGRTHLRSPSGEAYRAFTLKNRKTGNASLPK